MTLFAISFGWVAAALGRSRVCARSALAFSGARSAPKRSTLFAISSGWAAAAGRRWVAGGFESWLPLESRSLHKHAYVVVEFCGQLGWWIFWRIFRWIFLSPRLGGGRWGGEVFCHPCLCRACGFQLGGGAEWDFFFGTMLNNFICHLVWGCVWHTDSGGELF